LREPILLPPPKERIQGAAVRRGARRGVIAQIAAAPARQINV